MLLIDSDGVLVDWEGYVIGTHFPSRTMESINKLDADVRYTTLNGMYQRDPNLFAKLKPLVGATDLIRHVKNSGVNYAVLTAAGTDHSDYEVVRKDKVRNLSALFGIPTDKIIVTRTSKHKKAYAKVGRVLVDDYIKNCQEFEDAGGRSVHVTHEGLLNGSTLRYVHEEIKVLTNNPHLMLL